MSIVLCISVLHDNIIFGISNVIKIQGNNPYHELRLINKSRGHLSLS